MSTPALTLTRPSARRGRRGRPVASGPAAPVPSPAIHRAAMPAPARLRGRARLADAAGPHVFRTLGRGLVCEYEPG